MESLELGKRRLAELRPQDAIPALVDACQASRTASDRLGLLESEAYLHLAKAMRASLAGDAATCGSERTEALKCFSNLQIDAPERASGFDLTMNRVYGDMDISEMLILVRNREWTEAKERVASAATAYKRAAHLLPERSDGRRYLLALPGFHGAYVEVAHAIRDAECHDLGGATSHAEAALLQLKEEVDPHLRRIEDPEKESFKSHILMAKALQLFGEGIPLYAKFLELTLSGESPPDRRLGTAMTKFTEAKRTVEATVGQWEQGRFLARKAEDVGQSASNLLQAVKIAPKRVALAASTKFIKILAVTFVVLVLPSLLGWIDLSSRSSISIAILVSLIGAFGLEAPKFLKLLKLLGKG